MSSPIRDRPVDQQNFTLYGNSQKKSGGQFQFTVCDVSVLSKQGMTKLAESLIYPLARTILGAQAPPNGTKITQDGKFKQITITNDRILQTLFGQLGIIGQGAMMTIRGPFDTPLPVLKAVAPQQPKTDSHPMRQRSNAVSFQAKATEKSQTESVTKKEGGIENEGSEWMQKTEKKIVDGLGVTSKEFKMALPQLLSDFAKTAQSKGADKALTQFLENAKKLLPPNALDNDSKNDVVQFGVALTRTTFLEHTLNDFLEPAYSMPSDVSKLKQKINTALELPDKNKTLTSDDIKFMTGVLDDISKKMTNIGGYKKEIETAKGLLNQTDLSDAQKLQIQGLLFRVRLSL